MDLWRFPLDDELVIVRPDVPGLFLLNSGARILWDRMNSGASPEEVAVSLSTRFGIPLEAARRDVDAAMLQWSQGLLRPAAETPAETDEKLTFSPEPRIVECVLNENGFRVVLDSDDLVEEIAPRLLQTAVPGLPRDVPFVTLRVTNGTDRVFVFRDGACIAKEEKTAGARAVLLQEMTRLCDRQREVKVILHAGACGTSSAGVILAGASHAGKSTLCASLMAEGFYCYSDDSAVIDEQFRVAGMPFPLMLREGSWPMLAPKFDVQPDPSPRWGEEVRFLPSNLPGNSSPSVPVKALVFVDYRPRTELRFQPLTSFEVLMRLKESGFWVEHDRETIGRFLDWIGRLPCYGLTYSSIEDATKVACDLLC